MVGSKNKKKIKKWNQLKLEPWNYIKISSNNKYKKIKVLSSIKVNSLGQNNQTF